MLCPVCHQASPEGGCAHGECPFPRPAVESRASAMLRHEGDAAKRKADRASSEKLMRATRNSGSWTVDKIATMQGRPIEIVAAENGVMILDPAAVLLNKFLFGFSSRAQVDKFIAALESAAPGANTRARAVDRWLSIEKTMNAWQIKDEDLSGHGAVLCALNGHQLGRLIEALQRGLPDGR